MNRSSGAKSPALAASLPHWLSHNLYNLFGRDRTVAILQGRLCRTREPPALHSFIPSVQLIVDSLHKLL